MSSENNTQRFYHNSNNKGSRLLPSSSSSPSDFVKSAMKKPSKPCKTERDCWTVFVNVCELTISDLETIRGMEYTTTSRVAMIGLHRDVDALLDAGIPHAKAHMILLFAVYVLLCKQSGAKIPKNLTFDDVMELNFQIANSMVEASSKVDCSHFTAASLDTSSKSSKGSSSHGNISVGSGNSKKGRNGIHGKKKGGKTKKDKNKKVSWSSKSSSSSSCEGRRKYCHSSQMKNYNRDSSVSSLMDESLSLHSIPEVETCEDTEAETVATASSRWDADAGSTVSDSLLMTKRKSDQHNRKMAAKSTSTRSVVSAGGDSCAIKPSRRPSFDVGSPIVMSEDFLAMVNEGCEPNGATDDEEDCTGRHGKSNAQPPRRKLRGMDLDTDIFDYVAPMEPWERSTLKWAVALDVDEDLTDSEWETDSSDGEYDTDDEEESDVEEEQEEEQQKVLQQPQVFRWQTQNVTMHELKLPENKVLPFQFQDLFRDAALNPEMNIQEKIQMALGRTPMAA